MDRDTPDGETVQSLRRELQRLRNLETARSQFLATVSHELRTPLTAVLSYAEALAGGTLGELSDPQREAVDSVARSARQSLEMVEEILAYSRSGGESAELTPTGFSLAELIEDIRRAHESMLRRKGLTFRTRLPEDLPGLFADRGKIEHVLSNLVSNAIEFTEPGGRVEIRARETGERGWLRVEVVDTGMGIAPEDHEAIFEEFVSLDTEVARELGGTGLGLSIARRIVRMHGGEIGVESAPGRGSLFHFTLPTEENQASLAGSGSGAEPGDATSG